MGICLIWTNQNLWVLVSVRLPLDNYYKRTFTAFARGPLRRIRIAEFVGRLKRHTCLPESLEVGWPTWRRRNTIGPQGICHQDNLAGDWGAGIWVSWSRPTRVVMNDKKAISPCEYTAGVTGFSGNPVICALFSLFVWTATVVAVRTQLNLVKINGHQSKVGHHLALSLLQTRYRVLIII